MVLNSIRKLLNSLTKSSYWGLEETDHLRIKNGVKEHAGDAALKGVQPFVTLGGYVSQSTCVLDVIDTCCRFRIISQLDL